MRDMLSFPLEDLMLNNIHVDTVAPLIIAQN